MAHLSLIAVLVALVCVCGTFAQDLPTISTDNADLNLEVARDKDIFFSRERRDETVSIWGLNDRLTSLELRNKALQDQLASSMSPDDVTAKLSALRDAIKSDILATFQTSMSTVVQSAVGITTVVQNDIIARTTTLQSSINGLEADIVQKASTQVSDAVNDSEDRTDSKMNALYSALSSLNTTVKATLSASASALNSSLSTSRTDLNNQLTGADSATGKKISDVTTKITSLESDLSKIMGSVNDMGNVKMWSGYCTVHGRSNPSDYCLDKTEWSTATAYLRVENNYQFLALEDGAYRINFFCISLESYNHVLFFIDGVIRHYGHEYSTGAWTDNFMDITWNIKKGQRFWVRVYGSNYAYHSGNPNGAHSRMQVTYLGKSLDMDVPD